MVVVTTSSKRDACFLNRGIQLLYPSGSIFINLGSERVPW